jgi:drug/metabolite transporter (DMT)-like permease
MIRLSNTKPATRGAYAALASAFFLGLAPVFGRQAILLGAPWLAVVAARTTLAAVLMLVVMLIFQRPYLYIYPAGMLGCLLAGWINGLGSLFYYSALVHLGAGVGQLLYSFYPLFLAVFLALDNQPPTRLTLYRLLLALPAIYMLTYTSGQPVNLLGVFEMLIASALYALHLPINQRVLYDMPAPTVTLYTLLSMSAIVLPTFLFSGFVNVQSFADIQITLSGGSAATSATGIQFQTLVWPILGLTLVTFLSRVTLFAGVKHLGGMQTALLGVSELLITVLFAHIWLHEHLSWQQWLGAALLVVSLLLAGLEKSPPKKLTTGGFLSWIRPAGLPTDAWQSHD